MFIFRLCVIGFGILVVMLLLALQVAFEKHKPDRSICGALAQIALALMLYTLSLSLAFNIGDGHDIAHGLHVLLVFFFGLIGIACYGIEYWKAKRRVG